jgi:hypothetical protein
MDNFSALLMKVWSAPAIEQSPKLLGVPDTPVVKGLIVGDIFSRIAGMFEVVIGIAVARSFDEALHIARGNALS